MPRGPGEMTVLAPGSGTRSPTRISPLSPDLVSELWARIAGRLRRGETLITPVDFQSAMEEEYERAVGKGLTPEVRPADDPHLLPELQASPDVGDEDPSVAYLGKPVQ